MFQQQNPAEEVRSLREGKSWNMRSRQRRMGSVLHDCSLVPDHWSGGYGWAGLLMRDVGERLQALCVTSQFFIVA